MWPSCLFHICTVTAISHTKSTAHKSLPSYKSILISVSIQYLYCIVYIGSFLYCTVQYTGKQYIQKYILPQNDSISHCTILNLRPYLGNIFLLIIQNILSLQRWFLQHIWKILLRLIYRLQKNCSPLYRDGHWTWT